MVWDGFDDSVKQQLQDEDREAWTAICTILLAIIIFGVFIATIANAVLIITT